MNIVVLSGGLSTERDVSIKSGSLIARALCERGHNAVLIDSFFGYDGDADTIFDITHTPKDVTISETAPDIAAVWRQRNQPDNSKIASNLIAVCRKADIVFMAMHGEDGENGKMQALFDIENIKYTGSGYLGSAVAMNKELAKILFRTAGILTPDSFTVRRNVPCGKKPEYPCVVKPCNGGSSIGVAIVHNDAEYEKALKEALILEPEVLVEQYIKGRELTVGVLEHTAMPVIEIIPKTSFYDYKNKYQAGLTDEICPAPITAEQTKKVQELSVMAMDALGIDTYCRVDFLMDDKGDFYCLEANTLPGMTPTSLLPQAAREMGISYGELCEKIIEISLKNF